MWTLFISYFLLCIHSLRSIDQVKEKWIYLCGFIWPFFLLPSVKVEDNRDKKQVRLKHPLKRQIYPSVYTALGCWDSNHMLNNSNFFNITERITDRIKRRGVTNNSWGLYSSLGERFNGSKSDSWEREKGSNNWNTKSRSGSVNMCVIVCMW